MRYIRRIIARGVRGEPERSLRRLWRVLMPNFKPGNLVLRCYGYRSSDGYYIGVCVDLNIAVQAGSPRELRSKMADSIVTYIDTVLDTEDRDSIPALMSRRAPIQDWIAYYLIKFIVFVRNFRGRFVFKEHIPFHLAHNC